MVALLFLPQRECRMSAAGDLVVGLDARGKELEQMEG